MMNVDDAFVLIAKYMSHFSSEKVSLKESAGRRLEQDILADRPYPPFHRVTMDGIAVRYSEYLQGVRTYKIAGIQAAGAAPLELLAVHSCSEVMTGAVLPIGCDLVIPYEHLKHDGVSAQVTVESDRSPMQNVHLMGSDCASGEVLLNRGVIMHAPHTAIAASVGASEIMVEKQPRILIVSTGDELVEIDQLPLNYQIRKSNGVALVQSMQLAGLKNIELAHLPDDLTSIRSFYVEHIANFDILIFTGGVSKGKYDYLPQVFQEMQVQKHFHGVAQRPGKPMWFGIDEKFKTMILGLPGNPISCLVCMHRYILPNLMPQKKQIFSKLNTDILFKPDLAYFVPVKIEFNQLGEVWATPKLAQNSGEFAALSETDGFIELPRGKDQYHNGDVFKFYSWSPL